MSQDFFKESSDLQKLLKGIKKEDTTTENFDKLNILSQILNRDISNYSTNQTQKFTGKDLAEKVDLFVKANQKQFKYSDFEISEFIGNFHNDEIIKQYYLVDNIKTKINTVYNDNIEDISKKQEFNLLYKKFEKIGDAYNSERDNLLKEYSKKSMVNILNLLVT